MKKIINIIWTIILLSFISTYILSCKNKNIDQRFKEPILNKEIKKWIIAEIQDNKNYINYSFNSLFNKIDLKLLTIRLLNFNISKYYYSIEENTRAKFTEITHKIKKLDNYLINNQIVAFIKQVALDKLYTEYLTGINDNTYLEFKIANEGYLPNYQTYNWYIQGIKSNFLNNSQFADFDIFKKTKQELKKELYMFNNKNIINASSQFVGFNLLNEEQKKKALEIRFHDYFICSIVPTIIDTILTSTYLHQNQFKVYNKNTNIKEKIIYINKFNTLFNNIQSWENNNNWKTYIKLIWEAKMDKKKLKQLMGANNENIIHINNNLAHNTNKNILFKTLKNIFNNKNNNIKQNVISEGIDPFFGLNGFKGIAAFNKSDNNMFTQFKGDISYIEDIKNQTKSGIMIANPNTPITETSRYQYISTNQKEASIVFVLPIYTIDLLKNLSFNYTDGNINNKKLYIKYYGLKGIPIDLDFQWLNQGLSIKWLYNTTGCLGTRDEYGNILYNDDGTPKIQYNEKIWKTNLLKWIEYTMSQNPTLQTSSKNRLYSLAFAYNSNNIYSQIIYDEIGHYIQKEEEEEIK